jgi:hypothetical protein
MLHFAWPAFIMMFAMAGITSVLAMLAAAVLLQRFYGRTCLSPVRRGGGTSRKFSWWPNIPISRQPSFLHRWHMGLRRNRPHYFLRDAFGASYYGLELHRDRSGAIYLRYGTITVRAQGILRQLCAALRRQREAPRSS